MEGLFTPDQCPVPGLEPDAWIGAMVRVLPRTWLMLDWAASAEEIRARSRNEALADGSECWHRCFLREDAAKVADPRFAMGMVRHEFAKAITAGMSLPVKLPLDGGGSGFAISPDGHVLTNYHLVTSEIGNHGRQAGAIGQEVACRTLRVQIAQARGPSDWVWRDAERVWLVSNPAEREAIVDHGDGTASLRTDVALLRVEPAPASHLRLDTRPVEPGARVWMAGFPLRSARASAALARAGYADADGSLRVSVGEVTGVDASESFATDCDGSMGSSGSPVFDASGRVRGLFSRAEGDGPRAAFEYGCVRRIQVSAALAAASLGLGAVGAEGFAATAG